MQEKTQFWILLIVLGASIALLLYALTHFGHLRF